MINPIEIPKLYISVEPLLEVKELTKNPAQVKKTNSRLVLGIAGVSALCIILLIAYNNLKNKEI